jgi:hypothetical protein
MVQKTAVSFEATCSVLHSTSNGKCHKPISCVSDNCCFTCTNLDEWPDRSFLFHFKELAMAVWGTLLQAGRSLVRVSDKVNFFNSPNPSSRPMAPRSTQPLIEMSTRNFPGGKEGPARRADNLAAICEPNVWKCGIFILSNPRGFHGLYRDNLNFSYGCMARVRFLARRDIFFLFYSVSRRLWSPN